MKQIMPIFKKEFLSYFRTNIGYFILTIYIVLSMILTFYASYFFQLNNSDLFSLFYLQPQVLALLVPGITMRLWSEEKKSGTIEFLLTQPLSYKSVIISKYLAALAFGTLMLATTIPFLIYNSFLTPLDGLNILSGYAGCFLTMAAFCAVGSAVSAFNKNSIPAYLISFLLCWIISFSSFSFLFGGNTEITSILLQKASQSLNFYKHYMEFVSGQVSLDNLIYFITIIVFALWTNSFALENFKSKKHSLTAFLIMIAMSFSLINISSALLFGEYKSDLTKDNKFSLSEGSIRLIKDIEPIAIRIYVSPSLSKEYPQIGQYSDFVIRFIKQYQKHSNGRIEVEVRSVDPYSPLEKEAISSGIRPFLDNTGKVRLYFGAHISNQTGDFASIPTFVPQRSDYLETDVSRIIHSLTNERKTVGLISPNKIKDQNFIKQLGINYKVVNVSADTPQIPRDIDTLIFINNKSLAAMSTYAVDQFILRGGKLLAFLDSYSEYQAYNKPIANFITHPIDKVFSNLGLELFPEASVGDINLSERAFINGQIKNYYPWINVTENYINQKSPITKGLHLISLKSPIVMGVDKKEGSNIEYTSLFTTSEAGGIVNSELLPLADKSIVLNSYQQSNLKLDLAVLIKGTFNSIYTENIMGGTENEDKILPFIIASIEPTEIIAVSDTDMLFDQSWALIDPNLTQDNEIYGVIPINNNYDFVQRSTDYLSGNDILLDIRARNSSHGKKSLIAEIGEKIYLSHKEEYNFVNHKLVQIEDELNQMLDELESGQANLTISFSKQLADKKEEIAKLQESAQYLDYVSKKEKESYVYKIIILNTLLFPLLLILIVWFANYRFFANEKKKALELLNEQKTN